MNILDAEKRLYSLAQMRHPLGPRENRFSTLRQLAWTTTINELQTAARSQPMGTLLRWDKG